MFGDLEMQSKWFLVPVHSFDKNWIYNSTLKIKEQSKQWSFRSESALKMAEAVSSANRVMVTVFWDVLGISLFENLEKANLLDSSNYTVR